MRTTSPTRCPRAATPASPRSRALALALAVVAGASLAFAQDPKPAAPAPGGPDPAAPRDALGRRVTNGKTTTLAFKNVTVEQVVPFIVESTGKVVLPQNEVLSRRITIINDIPISQSQALDLVLLALQQTGIAVVETDSLITLRDIAEIERQDVPVIGPEQSTLGRGDFGSIAEKVYALRSASAKNIGEVVKESIPDYATLAIDEESNQLVLRGNMALLQRMERLISSLDKPNAATLATATYRLRYADADQVATNIKDLYEQNRTNQGQQNQQQNPFRNFFGGGGPPGFGGGGDGGGRGGGGGGGQNQQGNRNNNNNQRGGNQDQQASGTSANLRVTANKQQNSVTVLAEQPVLDQIKSLIETIWDQPLPEEAVIPKIYDLKNSDPIKVRDVLTGLFGSPTGQSQSAQSSQGVGRLAGQFSFQAIPEAQRLVVVAKSPDNIFVIDQIIDGLDQPQSAGLPEIIELKHASAEELAEQLNTLLAQEGTLASIRRAESGLSDSSANQSPFASEQTQQDSSGTQGNNTNSSTQNSTEFINFWWQRARPPTDSRGASNLVSKLRIVPVWRQNAVMILAPAEYKHSVMDLVRSMDKPGRQVLLSAVVAEISLEDATALGLRWSNQAISTTNPDNVFSVETNSQGTKNDFLSGLFDTSVLNASTDLNILLQALNQKTAINILSEPRIFTADNQEAEFFDGQDIPFITDSQTNEQGGVVQSFDYRAVGIQLRVRPRITVNRDVDLRVNLELSSIQPQQTLFGGFIIDRRETTTQLIVRNGQTIVISGILRSETSDIKRKVPLLGDIPLLGALFTSIDKEVTRTELVAFITPVVVDNPTEVQELNAPFQQRLGELRRMLTGQEIQPPSPNMVTPGVTEPVEVPPPSPPSDDPQ